MREEDVEVNMSRMNNDVTIYVTHKPTGTTTSAYANAEERSTFTLRKEALDKLRALLKEKGFENQNDS